MTIQCQCGTTYNYDERKLEGVASKKVKCTKCQRIIVVVNPGYNTGSQAKVEKAGPESTVVMEPAQSPSPGPIPMEPRTGLAAQRTEIQEKKFSPEGTLLPGSSQPSKLEQLEKPRFYVTVYEGGDVARVVHIDKPTVTVGRSGVDIEIQDPEASRRHAQIEVTDRGVILRDLNSTNGTYVKGQRITTTQLENQSEFRIGDTTFVLGEVSVSFD